MYVTDTLQAIAENTAVPASAYTSGGSGKCMARRWADVVCPAPAEVRTPEQVIDHIRDKLKEV